MALSLSFGKLLSGAGDIYGGIAANASALDEASLLEEQGALTRDDYARQAALVREDGARTRAKQTMEYISAGVEAVGTPQLVARETLSKSTAKAGALDVTGLNYQKLYGKKAQITRNEGQAALVSGIMKGAGSMLDSVSYG
jgi:hypothetical protein